MIEISERVRRGIDAVGARRRVAVVGGGIGGLATAVALRRSGHEVQVFERRESREDLHAGGGVVLWHNGVAALRRLGLAESVEKIAPTLENHEFRSWRGGVLASWPVGDAGRSLKLPALSVSRAALHRLLTDAAGDVLALGRRCTGFERAPRSAAAVRRRNDGGLRRPHRRGRRGLGRADAAPGPVRAASGGLHRLAGGGAGRAVTRHGSDGVLTNIWGRGLRFMSFRIDAGDLVYWDAIVAHGAADHAGESPQEMLLRRFDGWHAPVAELIAMTPEATIAPIEVADQRPAAQWGAGRVTLLGDAAHPMTFNLGQGACQALEDTVVLADAIGNATRHRDGTARVRAATDGANGGHDRDGSAHRSGRALARPRDLQPARWLHARHARQLRDEAQLSADARLRLLTPAGRRVR